MTVIIGGRPVRVGDTVEWTSKSNGTDKSKRGLVVWSGPGPSDISPSKGIGGSWLEGYKSKLWIDCHRHCHVNNEVVRPMFEWLPSYGVMVLVENPSGRGKPKLYAPRTNRMKVIEEASA